MRKKRLTCMYNKTEEVKKKIIVPSNPGGRRMSKIEEGD